MPYQFTWDKGCAGIGNGKGRTIDLDRLGDYSKKELEAARGYAISQARKAMQRKKRNPFQITKSPGWTPRRHQLANLAFKICYYDSQAEEGSERTKVAGKFRLLSQVSSQHHTSKDHNWATAEVWIYYEKRLVFRATLSNMTYSGKLSGEFKCKRDIPGSWEKELENGWDRYWEDFFKLPYWQMRVTNVLGSCFPYNLFKNTGNPVNDSWMKMNKSKREMREFARYCRLCWVPLIFPGVDFGTYKYEAKNRERPISNDSPLTFRSMEDDHFTVEDAHRAIDREVDRRHWENDRR